ncbi:MAG: M23 family metallopeptidase [Chitinophagaceae bacterium]|nr:M23 family metallopeptidase [Chitinophagaceae bacterium]
MQKKIFVLLFYTFCFYVSASAQIFPKKNYPQGYFSWPVAAPIGLAANFGELRPNHFHMGLDCRTNQKENQQVLAAADGYIAKVKIEPYGFGRAIYINHPNGLTTLYAHLNDFNTALEKYVSEQQYAQQSWGVFLDIPADLFPVKKGAFIAYSGNTGGSQGPHVHFEIRDTKTDKVLNPLLFGFPITDKISPDILKLAMYDRCISTYEQIPKFFTLKKANGVYITTPALIIANTDKVSFAVTAFDRYTGSTNKNGIYKSIIYDNEAPQAGFELDSISYNETRYLNAHIDYKLRSNGGAYVQHLSKLPGDNSTVYKEINGDGVINIDDDSIHTVKIEVYDAYGNLSLLQFKIKRGPETDKKLEQDSSAYFKQKMFHPGFVNIFENDKISFILPGNALYDSMRFRYSETMSKNGSVVFQLHNTNVPLHKYFTLKIKNSNTNFSDKMVISRSGADFSKALYENGWYKASFRSFGNFQLMVDTIPPVITPVGFKSGMNAAKLNQIVFTINDNTEELKNFTATIDGNWVRFTNDKGRKFIYSFDEKLAAGNHVLNISVEDMVGNKTEKIFYFTR